MRWLVALAGWGMALWGWKVRGRQSREIADNAEINKAIDAALDRIEKLEETAILFWKDPDAAIVPVQVNSAVDACIFYTQQLISLHPSRELPTELLSELRKQVTTDIETETRGFDYQRTRISRLVRMTGKLKRQPVYKKHSLIKKKT
jgi:hypothetical protein